MKIKSTLWLAVAGMFIAQIFTSCSSVEISKRRYNKGFYVDLGGKAKTEQTVTAHEATPVTPATGHDVNTVATTPTVNDIKEQLSTLSASTHNIIAKKAIRKINRQLETLAASSAAEDKGASVSAENHAPKDVTAAKAAKKTMGGSKSQLVALILCFFLGGLGIHRFYLGYTWQGVVQLLTAGGCGIWALIDFIRIITGDLQPKDGRYDKTL